MRIFLGQASKFVRMVSSGFVQPRKARKGQTLVEYALILAILSIVVIGVIINLSKAVTGIYSTITSTVASGVAPTH